MEKENEIYNKMKEIFKTEPVMVTHLEKEGIIILNPANNKGDVSFKTDDFLGFAFKKEMQGNKEKRMLLQIYSKHGYITYYFDGEYFDVSVESTKELIKDIRKVRQIYDLLDKKE